MINDNYFIVGLHTLCLEFPLQCNTSDSSLSLANAIRTVVDRDTTVDELIFLRVTVNVNRYIYIAQSYSISTALSVLSSPS